MALPEISDQEATFDYVIKNNLDEIIDQNQAFEGLEVSLQPQIPAGGRADVIVKDGMKPLIVFETKKDDRQVKSLQVHRKAREYALNLKAKYFVVSNLRRTYLFKNDMGPLRELQLNLWESQSPMKIQIVLDEILKLSLNEQWVSSRMDTFLERYKLLLKDVQSAYSEILDGNGRMGRDKLKKAEKGRWN